MDNYILIELENGGIVKVLNTQISEESDVSDETMKGKFSEILPSITEVCSDFLEMLKKTNPTKASIQFGVDLGIESSGIIALITKANANTNFQITLEWEPNKKNK